MVNTDQNVNVTVMFEVKNTAIITIQCLAKSAEFRNVLNEQVITLMYFFFPVLGIVR